MKLGTNQGTEATKLLDIHIDTKISSIATNTEPKLENTVEENKAKNINSATQVNRTEALTRHLQGNLCF